MANFPFGSVRSSIALVAFLLHPLAVHAGGQQDARVPHCELPAPSTQGTSSISVEAGGSQKVTWTPPLDGTLHVWTRAHTPDFDPRLRIESANGELLAKDDDAAGDREAFAKLDVRAGMAVAIVVDAQAPSTSGRCELNLVLAHETEATRAIARRTIEMLAPYDSGNVTGAPADFLGRLKSAWPEMRDTPGAADSADVDRAAWKVGVAGIDFADAAFAAEVFTWVEAWRTRFLPPHHVDLQKTRMNLGVQLQELELLEPARDVLVRVVDSLSRSTSPDESLLLDARSNLGVTNYRIGDYEQARVLLEQVLQAKLRMLPEDHPSVLDAKRNLAATLGYLGEHESALVLETAVLDVLQHDPRADPVLVRKMLSMVAGTHEALGDYASSIPLLETLLHEQARVLDPGAEELLDTRRLLARAYGYVGDLSRARDLQREMVAAAEATRPPDDLVLARLRIDLGVSLQLLGELDEARALQLGVLERLRAVLPEDDRLLQKSRLNTAEVLEYAGEYERALELYEEAYAILSRPGREQDSQFQRATAGVARLSRQAGDLERARVLGERLLAVMESSLPDDQPQLQLVRLELGSALFDQGDLAAARVLQEKAVAVLSRRDDGNDGNLQAARSKLAHTLMMQGDLEEARRLQESVLQAFERTLPEESPERLAALASLANTMQQEGDAAKALELMERARAGFERWHGEDSRELQGIDINMAVCLDALGQHDRAAELILHVRSSWDAHLPADHLDRSMVQRNLVVNRVMARDEAGAAREARSLAGLILDLLRAPESRTARENEERAYALRIAAATVAMCVTGSENASAMPSLGISLFEVVETLRAPALVHARIARGARGPVLDRIRFEEREAARTLAARTRAGADADTIEKARARLESVRREQRTELARNPAAAEADVRPSAQAVAARLGPGQVLVGYWRHAGESGFLQRGREVGSSRLLANVLRPEGAVATIDLGPIAAIEEAVDDWRQSLGVSGPSRGLGRADSDGAIDERAGSALRTRILDPLLPAIGDAHELIVLPDDVLCTVAFDALPLDAGVVGDRFGVEIRLSARELLWAPPSGSASERFLAVGGVDFRPAPIRTEPAEDQPGTEESPVSEDAPVAIALLRGGPFEHGFQDLPGSPRAPR